MASERLTETRQLARGAAQRIEDSARRFESTSQTVETLSADLPWGNEVLALQPLSAEALGYEVLGFIYVAGLPLRDFQRASEASGRRGDLPAGMSVPQACIASADASRAFGHFLAEWEPGVGELLGSSR